MNVYHQARVVEITQETPTVTTVEFTVEGTVLPFTAGQYISVYFDDLQLKAGKAYSLSSAPSDATMSITVKRIGEFSNRICNLKPGDSFKVSSPFGFFNADDTLPIVAIAAGVGIAPIWSILKDTLRKKDNAKATVHLTAPLAAELVFREKIDALALSSAHVFVKYYVTREDAESLNSRRFTVAQDIDASRPCRYYICGSETFVRSIWLQLMEAGIPEAAVVTETFFEAHQ